MPDTNDTRRQLEAVMSEACRKAGLPWYGLGLELDLEAKLATVNPADLGALLTGKPRAWTPAPHRVPATSTDDIHCHVQRAVVHDSHVEIGGSVMLPDEVVLEVEHWPGGSNADEHPLIPPRLRFAWPDDRHDFAVLCVLQLAVNMGRVNRLTYSVEEV